MMKGLLMVFLNIFALSLAVAQTTLPPELARKIDSFITESMSAGKVPGLSLVIVQNGEVVYSKGYGYANLATQTPMTEHTLVPIGSTGKGMTALAVMQLVEQGKLELDAPITTYLPWFKVDDEHSSNVTLRHLLTHTSGLPLGGLYDGKQDAEALERHVRSLATVKLNRVPGDGYEYSNDGYAILGLVVQAVSGMPYEDYMEEHIFTPMNMNDTTFDPVTAAEQGLAQGYATRGGVVTPVDTPFSRAIAPAGMVISNANDVGHYFVSLLNENSIVSQVSLETMWHPAVPLDPQGQNAYGFGWGVLDMGDMTLVTHTGSIFSSGSFFVLEPSQKVGVGVLVNLQNTSSSQIGQGVFMLLSGAEVPPVQATPAPQASTFIHATSVWQTYVGDYTTRREPLRVSVEDGKLIISEPGSVSLVRLELIPYSDTDFVMINTASRSDLDLLSATFKVEKDGTVTLLVAGQVVGVKEP
jgi:CubicO group peptidase (beta-lactamase class C family)